MRLTFLFLHIATVNVLVRIICFLFCREIENGDIKFYSAGKFAYIKNPSDIIPYFKTVLKVVDKIECLYGIPHSPEKIVINYKSISSLNIPVTTYFKPESEDVKPVETLGVDPYLKLHNSIMPLNSEFFFKFNYSICNNGLVSTYTGIANIVYVGLDKKDDVIILFFIKELLSDGSFQGRIISPIAESSTIRRITISSEGLFTICLPNNNVYTDKIIDGKIC